MDAPPIQYARTPAGARLHGGNQLTDGVNIAYASLGSGDALPLVLIGTALWSLQNPQGRDLRFRYSLAAQRRVILIDSRGSGLSGGSAADAWQSSGRDVAAVADAAGLDRFALLAGYRSVTPAVRLSAELNDRVRCLILWSGTISNIDHAATPRITALEHLIDADWEVYTDAIGVLLAGRSSPPDHAREISDAFRRNTTPDQLSEQLRSFDVQDAAPFASSLTVPTLVVHRRDAGVPTLDHIQDLAAAMPNASLRILSGDAVFPQYGDTAEALQVIESFLDQHDRPDTDAEDGARPVSALGAFRTILFTDLESSTALTQKLGDDKAQEILRGHNGVVRAALAANDGEEVKHTGDGIMASFGSAVSAVQAALQIQRDLAGGEIRVRVGCNAGEPIAEDHDYFGTAVQLAARLCDRAEPGQILVSNVVRELCAGKTFTFDALGAASLKGFDDPVALFAVSSPSPNPL